MILNSIIIENIRSYMHEEIVFPQGITLFEGDIGSGKSSILMAIEFALFGLGSQKAEGLLAKKEDTGHVILGFTVDEKKYEIKRTLKRNDSGINQDPANSWIKIDNEKLPLSPSELKQIVLQILRFNEPGDPRAESKIFRYAVYTPQEAMKEVLSDFTKRLETIRKAFKIEKYGIAKSNAKEVINEIKSRTRLFQDRFKDIPKLKEEIENSSRKILESNQRIEQLSKSIETEKNNEQEIIVRIKELQEKNNEQIEIKIKKDNLEQKINSDKNQKRLDQEDLDKFKLELDENQERLEKFEKIKQPETKLSVTDIKSEINKFQKLNDDLIRLKANKDSLSKRITELKGLLEEKINEDPINLKKRLEGLEKEKETSVEKIEEIRERINKNNIGKAEKNTQKQGLEKEIAEFTKLGNACPTCKQEITEKHQHNLVIGKQEKVESLEKELKDNTDSFFESDSKLKEEQKKRDSYQKEINEIQDILPRISEHTEKSSKLCEIDILIKENMESKDEKYGQEPTEYLLKLKDELIKYENAAEQIKHIIESKQKREEQITEKRTNIQKLDERTSQQESELDKTRSKVDSFEDIGGQISELDIKQEKYRETITKISTDIAVSKNDKNNEQERVSQNNTKITESEKWEKKFNIFSQYKEWLEDFFIPTVTEIEKQVMLATLQSFNETYMRWYSILIEDSTKESRINENFTPVINQDGFDQEIEFLSGGEKTSIALAYRLTLNSLMRKEVNVMKSNLLILDEPTDGFSKNQLGKIREVLDELKSEQIILVSHEEQLEAHVDNVFKVSKENGLSKITKTS